MNPAIERQLAQVRARYARTPLPRFFAWWGRELLACLPAKWRALFEERPECLLVEPADDALIVWRDHAGEVREHARVVRTLAPEAQRAELLRLRGASEPDARMLLCIDSDRVLHRHLSLPAAAWRTCARCWPSRWIGRRLSRRTRSTSTRAPTAAAMASATSASTSS
ncbi:MAG: hypothetical protein U1F23_07130 [Lysobacterales bacterium]